MCGWGPEASLRGSRRLATDLPQITNSIVVPLRSSGRPWGGVVRVGAQGAHWLGPGRALVWALGPHWFGPWARIGLGPEPALVWAPGPHWLHWLSPFGP